MYDFCTACGMPHEVGKHTGPPIMVDSKAYPPKDQDILNRDVKHPPKPRSVLNRHQRVGLVWTVVCIVYGYLIGFMLGQQTVHGGLWLVIVVMSGGMVAFSYVMGVLSKE